MVPHSAPLLVPATATSSLLLPWYVLVACGLLLVPARVTAQQSLSAPISGSVGPPVYSETTQGGPSTSLFTGSQNVQTPYLRTGVSDPLSYLLESGTMSPFLGVSMSLSYPNSDVQSLIIAQSELLQRFSEYRDNRLLMGGTGGGSTLTGRAAAAGATTARSAGAMAIGVGGFSSASMRSPFAAGSLATRQAGMGGIGASGFLDPNLLVAAATSSSGPSSGLSSASALSGGLSGMGTGSTIYTTDESGAASGIFATTAGSAGSMIVTSVGDPVAGPAPGEVFPNITIAMPATSGFPDSTMGTAGAPVDVPDTLLSPLASERANSDASPFRALNAPASRFLDPSLFGLSGGAADASNVSFSEVRRKARLHAMIYNPGGELPSPFQQRAMERTFIKQHSGRHVPHQPKLTMQSGAGTLH